MDAGTKRLSEKYYHIIEAPAAMHVLFAQYKG